MDHSIVTSRTSSQSQPAVPVPRFDIFALARLVAEHATAHGWQTAGAFGGDAAVTVSVPRDYSASPANWAACHRLAVPRTLNDGRVVSPELVKELMYSAVVDFGGVTIYEAIGFCLAPPYFESDVLFDIEIWTDDDARVTEFAKKMARALDQREVKVREFAQRVRSVRRDDAAVDATTGTEPISAE